MDSKVMKIMSRLLEDKDNMECFDCGKSPAQWASVNNGIFLCLNCSGNHRSFGVNISFVKSATLDKWTEQQVMLMHIGGNRRLRLLLNHYKVPDRITPKDLYNSKLLNFYRRLLKAEQMMEVFSEEPPATNEALQPEGSNSSSSFSYPSLESLDLDQKINLHNDDNSNKFKGVDNFNFTTNRYSSNDNRFGSVGSEPLDDNDGYTASSGYFGQFGSFLSSAYQTTSSIASAVKDKLLEYEIPSKAANMLSTATTKVLETSKDIAESDTFRTITHKASNTLANIKSKLWGQSNRVEPLYGTEEEEVEESGSYTKMNDDNHLNENFIHK